MKNLRNLAIAILIPLLAGCATTEGYRKKVDSWKGSPDAKLIASWGVPTSTYNTHGCKFIQYKNSRTGIVPIGTSYYVVDSNCETTFKVKNGIIQSCTFRGNNCLAED